jgi:hypothetical protein
MQYSERANCITRSFATLEALEFGYILFSVELELRASLSKMSTSHRCNIVWRAHPGMLPYRRPRAQAKVTKLQHLDVCHNPVIEMWLHLDQQVVEFDVSVKKPFGMAVLNSTDELLEEIEGESSACLKVLWPVVIEQK